MVLKFRQGTVREEWMLSKGIRSKLRWAFFFVGVQNILPDCADLLLAIASINVGQRTFTFVVEINRHFARRINQRRIAQPTFEKARLQSFATKSQINSRRF